MNNQQSSPSPSSSSSNTSSIENFNAPKKPYSKRNSMNLHINTSINENQLKNEYYSEKVHEHDSTPRPDSNASFAPLTSSIHIPSISPNLSSSESPQSSLSYSYQRENSLNSPTTPKSAGKTNRRTSSSGLKKRRGRSTFPAAKIKRIMQSDEDIGKIATPVPIMISTALELFLRDLVTQSQQITRSKNSKTISLKHLKQCVMTDKNFHFMEEMMEDTVLTAEEHKEVDAIKKKKLQEDEQQQVMNRPTTDAPTNRIMPQHFPPPPHYHQPIPQQSPPPYVQNYYPSENPLKRQMDFQPNLLPMQYNLSVNPNSKRMKFTNYSNYPPSEPQQHNLPPPNTYTFHNVNNRFNPKEKK